MTGNPESGGPESSPGDETPESGKPEHVLLIETSDVAPQILAALMRDLPRIRKGNLSVSQGKLLIIDFLHDPNLPIRIIDQIKKANSLENIFSGGIKVVNPTIKSTEAIIGMLESHSDNDAAIIIGSQSLEVNYDRATTEVRSGELNLRFLCMNDLNWKSYSSKIEAILCGTKTNLFVLVDADLKCIDQILREFEHVDTDIIHCYSKHPEDSVSQRELLSIINSESYNSAMAKIDVFKGKISERDWIEAKAILLVKHGRREDAISVLEANYQEIDDSLRKLLADLYSAAGNLDKAMQILVQIHNQSPATQGLYESLARITLLSNRPEAEDWIKAGLQREPDNMKLLECAANFYNRKENFALAAQYRKRMFSVTHNPLDDLLTGILEIRDHPPQKGHEAELQLRAIVNKYAEHQEFEYQFRYRMALLWLDIYNSPFKAYEHLKEVPSQPSIPNSYNAALQRIELLKDPVLARKIFKSNENAIARERTTELLRDLVVLTTGDAGYLVWRDFILKAQATRTWEKSLSKSLLRYMDYSTVQTIKSLLSSSYLLRDSSQDGGSESMLNILRELKVSGSKEDTETYLVNSGAVIAEASLEEELWLRYELSLLCALNNRMQEANNHALSLWHFGNRDDRSWAALLPRVLGLIAWGNAQFRSGNTVEGVACIMASIPFSIQLEEVGGLVEDGVTILKLWVHNSKVFDDQSRKEFNDVITDILIGDEERKNINSLFAQHRWEELYTALNRRVNSDERGRDWPLDLFNYTQVCVQTDRKEEAYSLIMKHGAAAIKILESRRDARPSILHVWAQILLQALPPANDDQAVGTLKMTANLLELAISDLEKERQGFFHRDERANIMDRSRELYKMYLFTQVVAKITEGIESPAESKILAIFNLLSFRSIEELRLYRIEPSNRSQTSEREYWALLDEISSQRALGKSNTEIQDKIARFGELQDLLQQEHPSFSKLNRLPELSADELKASLRHRELFYQFVFTEYGTLYYLASNKNSSIGWISIQIEHTNRLMQSLALAMQDYNSFSKFDEDVMERAYGQASEVDPSVKTKNALF